MCSVHPNRTRLSRDFWLRIWSRLLPRRIWRRPLSMMVLGFIFLCCLLTFVVAAAARVCDCRLISYLRSDIVLSSTYHYPPCVLFLFLQCTPSPKCTWKWSIAFLAPSILTSFVAVTPPTAACVIPLLVSARVCVSFQSVVGQAAAQFGLLCSLALLCCWHRYAQHCFVGKVFVSNVLFALFFCVLLSN